MKIRQNWGHHFKATETKETSSSFAVPYHPISENRKREIESILSEGNELLAFHHDRMKKTNGLSRHDRTQFLNSISKLATKEDLEINGITIPEKDVSKILAVKNLEWEILCAFSNLITKLVLKKSRSEFDCSLSIDDLMSEAYQAVLYAISHYTQGETKLITFLHHCLTRHLTRVCNKTTGLSNLSSGAVKLKAKYNKLSCKEGATFDSIVAEMGISQKEISMLPSLLCKVQNMTSLEKDEFEIQVVDESAPPRQEQDKSIMRIVSDLGLTDLERAVLEGFVNSSSSKMGLNSVSKNLINPKTNKPYSRMAFTFAWRRIKEKIVQVYGRVA